MISGCSIREADVEQYTSRGELSFGGITGCNNGITADCSFSGSIKGNHVIHAKVNIGGIAGRNESGCSIERCYSDIDLDSDQNLAAMKMSYWGGICGFNVGNIKNSFSTGDMFVASDLKSAGKSYLGGITGALGANALIENCYQYAKLSGAYTKKGNVYGNGESTADAVNVFYIDSNGLTRNSGVPLTTVAMLVENSYFDFDFDSVWVMGDSEYPFPQLRSVPFEGSFEKVSVAGCEISDIGAVIYNGKLQEPAVDVTYNGAALRKDFDYTIRYVDNVDAGAASAVIEGIGRFTGELTAGFEILPADISNYTVVLEKTKYTATGKALKPAAVLQGFEENKDYKVNYSNNIYPGTAKVTVTGIGNYTGTIVCEFNITAPKVTALTKASASLYSKYNTIRASWTKGTGVSGYKVMWKKSSAKKWSSKRVTSSYASMPGLSAGAKYTVKIIPYVKMNGKYYEGSGVSKTVYTLKKLNRPSVKKLSSGKVRVLWQNINGETGYQISRATKQSATNVVATVKTTAGKSRVIKALKGKTCYYKVRAYKTVNGKKIYGPWSNTVKLKIK